MTDISAIGPRELSDCMPLGMRIDLGTKILQLKGSEHSGPTQTQSAPLELLIRWQYLASPAGSEAQTLI